MSDFAVNSTQTSAAAGTVSTNATQAIPPLPASCADIIAKINSGTNGINVVKNSTNALPVVP